MTEGSIILIHAIISTISGVDGAVDDQLINCFLVGKMSLAPMDIFVLNQDI
jgi:hypothetical protein